MQEVQKKIISADKEEMIFQVSLTNDVATAFVTNSVKRKSKNFQVSLINSVKRKSFRPIKKK